MVSKMRQELKNILRSERGVALMMIMTSIIILMAIYGEFTFESKISRIKATNIMDKSQAKLLAESGLQLAITRLRLYKEAFNKIQTNQQAKDTVSSQLLNQLWEVPFIFPIPVGKNASASFKDTVEKFSQETLLEGEMKVTIQNVSNRMNLNMLRVDMTKFNPQTSNPEEQYSQINNSAGAIQTDVSIKETLFFLLKRLVEDKKEKDEAFDAKYSNIDYQDLVTNLKYYMSDYMSMANDPLVGEAEQSFSRIPLTPKFGPLASASELYTIPGWDDQLIELIQNEFSVYPSAQIDLNKLTANMLRILIPTITDDQIKDFFLYRDDPQNPKFFNTITDFKKYVMTQRLMNESDFDKRIQLFQQRGITFGSNPNLFKIVSVGTYNRSNYTLIAYVVLPKQENNQSTQSASGTNPANPNQPAGGQAQVGSNPAGTSPTSTAANANQNTQLLEPRVIEIQIN